LWIIILSVLILFKFSQNCFKKWPEI
jgi:hypothetical protein